MSTRGSLIQMFSCWLIEPVFASLGWSVSEKLMSTHFFGVHSLSCQCLDPLLGAHFDMHLFGSLLET